MRMLKIALVLLVLASFVAATAAATTAATTTPTVKPTVKPTLKPTVTPVKKPSKLIDLSQMKSNMGNIYKKLKTMPTKAPGSGGNASKAVKSEASGIMNDVSGKIAQGKGSAPQLGVPAPQTITQLGKLPQMGATKAKIGAVPGANLKIALD